MKTKDGKIDIHLHKDNRLLLLSLLCTYVLCSSVSALSPIKWRDTLTNAFSCMPSYFIEINVALIRWKGCVCVQVVTSYFPDEETGNFVVVFVMAIPYKDTGLSTSGY